MKQIRRNLLLLAALLTFAASCGKESETGKDDDNTPVDPVETGFVTRTYQATNENFPNPERGLYLPSEVYRADGKGIAEASLRSARLQGMTLHLLEFHLTDYVETEIPDDYLETIRLKFQSLRDGGAKCILRFCYSNGFDESDKPWDATPELVKRHIQQVTPLIQEYYDIIFVVQTGFIGSWGEWYYTEHFTDNASRKQVVDDLLAAVPGSRQIELRTPAYKMKLYGLTLADTITLATAHQATAQSRLGGHNDCYLSSANDVGTFNGPSERKFWAAESLYTIMGGESCELTAYCHCVGTEKYNGALKDMAVYHVTYLNSKYHPSVLKRWREEGCMDEIKIRLGYRLVLEEGQFTKDAEAGKPFEIKLKLRNVGFATVQNPRDAEFVLTDASGKVVGTWPVDSDPRYWMPEEETLIEQTVTLPEGVSGSLTLSLNLPDPCETIHNNPLFSIRLANEGVWNEATGYNTLYTFSL